MSGWQEFKDKLALKWRSRAAGSENRGRRTRPLLVVLLVVLVVLLLTSWYWSREPRVFWVDFETEGRPAVTGFATTDALIGVANTLLDKPGGYLSNDIFPPGVFLDNIPNWEFGALIQLRDLARVLRNDYSRSQSQSTEDPDLANAEPLFNFDSERWIPPATEGRYHKAIALIADYQARLTATGDSDTQFYARADNLREWLAVVEKRLGSLSQRLSASVGQARVNTDLAGDPAADTATPRPSVIMVKTPWTEIDDVFFEARGSAWALVHFLRAAEYDFREVLAKKNAAVSLRQIIRELEASLEPLRSPIVLNGTGYGFFANHSLVMASYLSRANSAVINLRELLDQG
jgi:hypothetical protein